MKYFAQWVMREKKVADFLQYYTILFQHLSNEVMICNDRYLHITYEPLKKAIYWFIFTSLFELLFYKKKRCVFTL